MGHDDGGIGSEGDLALVRLRGSGFMSSLASLASLPSLPSFAFLPSLVGLGLRLMVRLLRDCDLRDELPDDLNRSLAFFRKGMWL